jgi:hypothetical protein
MSAPWLALLAGRKRETGERVRVPLLCISCFGKGPWELPTREPEYSDTVYSERHMEPPETDAERETWSIGGPAR